MEKRTSAVKAGYGSVIYGTAERVPFQDPVLTQTLKAPACTAQSRIFPQPVKSRVLLRSFLADLKDRFPGLVRGWHHG